MYIYQQKNWPKFTWDHLQINPKVSTIRHRQGKILGLMSAAGFDLKEKAILQTLTMDVTKSSEIEGELLNIEMVRSSIAKRLGIEIAGLPVADRDVEGVVEMMLDATQKYNDPLTEERLYNWHSAIFPTGRSSLSKIIAGNWRLGPIHVLSGAMGKEKVHFEAPDAERVAAEMQAFIGWFEEKDDLDPVLKAAIAHFWFVTIHPFDDGNGRITRAITDMQLARADKTEQRFYSMSAQIQAERNAYYDILERTQKGTLDITLWLLWFMDCLDRAMNSTDQILKTIKLRILFWEKHKNTDFNQRQYKMINILLDDFFGKLTVSKWSKMTKCSTDTALRDIQGLIHKNILVKEAPGGRSTHYQLKPA